MAQLKEKQHQNENKQFTYVYVNIDERATKGLPKRLRDTMLAGACKDERVSVADIVSLGKSIGHSAESYSKYENTLREMLTEKKIPPGAVEDFKLYMSKSLACGGWNAETFAIRRELQAPGWIGKMYRLFPSIESFIEWFKDQPEAKRVWHEVQFPHRPIKLGIDIDAEKDKIELRLKEKKGVFGSCNTQDEARAVIWKTVMDAVRKVFAEKVGVVLGEENLVVMDASAEKKMSKHVIVRGFHFSCHAQSAMMGRFIREELVEEHPEVGEFFDIQATGSVYGSLRMCENHKWADTRTLKLVSKHTFKDTLMQYIEKESVLLKTMSDDREMIEGEGNDQTKISIIFKAIATMVKVAGEKELALLKSEVQSSDTETLKKISESETMAKEVAKEMAVVDKLKKFTLDRKAGEQGVALARNYDVLDAHGIGSHVMMEGKDGGECIVCKRVHEFQYSRKLKFYMIGSDVWMCCPHGLAKDGTPGVKVGTYAESALSLSIKSALECPIQVIEKDLAPEIPGAVVASELQDKGTGKIKADELGKLLDACDTFPGRLPPGSGKTEGVAVNIGRWVEESEKPLTVVAISCKRALARGLTEAINSELKKVGGARIACYMDIPERKISIKKYGMVTIQVESLHRLDATELAVDVLFIDEINEVLSQFDHVTKAMRYSLNANFVTFESLVRQAKKVVCMDALLDARSVDMIRRMRPLDSHKWLGVSSFYAPRLQEKTVKILLDKEDLILAATVALMSGKKIAFPSNTRRSVMSVYAAWDKMFPKLVPEGKMVVYASDTSKVEGRRMKDERKKGETPKEIVGLLGKGFSEEVKTRFEKMLEEAIREKNAYTVVEVLGAMMPKVERFVLEKRGIKLVERPEEIEKKIQTLQDEIDATSAALKVKVDSLTTDEEYDAMLLASTKGIIPEMVFKEFCQTETKTWASITSKKSTLDRKQRKMLEMQEQLKTATEMYEKWKPVHAVFEDENYLVVATEMGERDPKIEEAKRKIEEEFDEKILEVNANFQKRVGMARKAKALELAAKWKTEDAENKTKTGLTPTEMYQIDQRREKELLTAYREVTASMRLADLMKVEKLRDERKKELMKFSDRKKVVSWKREELAARVFKYLESKRVVEVSEELVGKMINFETSVVRGDGLRDDEIGAVAQALDAQLEKESQEEKMYKLSQLGNEDDKQGSQPKPATAERVSATIREYLEAREKEEDEADINCDISERVRTVDVLAFSPKLSSGVSITCEDVVEVDGVEKRVPHFDDVFCYFSDASSDWMSCFQQMFRVRGTRSKVIHVAFFGGIKERNLPVNAAYFEQQIKSALTWNLSFKEVEPGKEYMCTDSEVMDQRALQMINTMTSQLNREGELEFEKDAHYYLHTWNSITRNRSRNRFVFRLLGALRLEGCKIEFVERMFNDEQRVQMKTFIGELARVDEARECLRVANAKDITRETREVLGKMKVRSEEEQLQWKKSEVRRCLMLYQPNMGMNELPTTPMSAELLYEVADMKEDKGIYAVYGRLLNWYRASAYATEKKDGQTIRRPATYREAMNVSSRRAVQQVSESVARGDKGGASEGIQKYAADKCCLEIFEMMGFAVDLPFVEMLKKGTTIEMAGKGLKEFAKWLADNQEFVRKGFNYDRPVRISEDAFDNKTKMIRSMLTKHYNLTIQYKASKSNAIKIVNRNAFEWDQENRRPKWHEFTVTKSGLTVSEILKAAEEKSDSLATELRPTLASLVGGENKAKEMRKQVSEMKLED